MNTLDSKSMQGLAAQIKSWGLELGFQQVGITNTDLSDYEARLMDWLELGYHGEMAYMARHGHKRSRPKQLIPGTCSVITARLDYLPPSPTAAKQLANPLQGAISMYAHGRDYHKLIRKKLTKLAHKISESVGEFAYRAFADSAPVLEKPLAEKSGLGWIGKHTNLINAKAGSWFFLGTLYTNLPLPADPPSDSSHCGSCRACIDICPTKAIVAPYQLDARRCISYLTIELQGSIPEPFRAMMGNRIYGCDDCQLVCPWNKFAKTTTEPDFYPRHNLDHCTLIELFSWSEQEFLDKTAGSAIRRIGHERWLRNIAVALGNALSYINQTENDTSNKPKQALITALQNRANHASALVREHVAWALSQA